MALQDLPILTTALSSKSTHLNPEHLSQSCSPPRCSSHAPGILEPQGLCPGSSFYRNDLIPAGCMAWLVHYNHLREAFLGFSMCSLTGNTPTHLPCYSPWLSLSSITAFSLVYFDPLSPCYQNVSCIGQVFCFCSLQYSQDLEWCLASSKYLMNSVNKCLSSHPLATSQMILVSLQEAQLGIPPICSSSKRVPVMKTREILEKHK